MCKFAALSQLQREPLRIKMRKKEFNPKRRPRKTLGRYIIYQHEARFRAGFLPLKVSKVAKLQRVALENWYKFKIYSDKTVN